MNAETRAKEIVDAENQFCEEHSLFVRGDTLDRLQAAIATAIRQAQNDKLEEAARAAEQSHLGMSCFVDAEDCGQFNSGVRHAAKAVRSLLEKD